MRIAEPAAKDEVEAFLATTRFAAYQSVPLPHGLRTPGRNVEPAVAHAIGGRVEGRSVLDVGTNYGLLPYMAMARGAREAVGVELDPERWRVAATIAELHGGRWSVLQGDVLELDLGRRFDVVFCLNVLHHVPDLVSAVRALAAHASGTLVLELVHPTSAGAFWSGYGPPAELPAAGRLAEALRRRTVRWLTRGLPLVAVGTNRSFFVSPEAFRNLFVGHLRFVSHVEVRPSLRSPGRWLAVCRIA